MSAANIVQRQFDAYNARDAEKLASFYADDAVIAVYQGPTLQSGRTEIKARYAKTFADHPENSARSIARTALGNVVIDHEVGSRGPNGPTFEAICIYTIRDGLIARVDFVSA